MPIEGESAVGYINKALVWCARLVLWCLQLAAWLWLASSIEEHKPLYRTLAVAGILATLLAMCALEYIATRSRR
jgi:hypothetical protein